jgi:DNA (cytosine-5)-methyltransferase 1
MPVRLYEWGNGVARMIHKAYYNEIDPWTAAWLHELIKQGHIEGGHVDTRSILDVRSVKDYVRCHFFAGIGGWDHALKLAGWPADRRVWTGSCPCQPFSKVGSKKGISDERHLWPEFFRLIKKYRPPTVFGEQVAGTLGLQWLSGVRRDLETIDYAVGAANLCAAGVRAPHVRQRLYWVANTISQGSKKSLCVRNGTAKKQGAQKKTTALAPHLGFEEWVALRNGMGEPGLFTNPDGIPESVGRLWGYGNAIVPHVAATFIQAFQEAELEYS